VTIDPIPPIVFVKIGRQPDRFPGFIPHKNITRNGLGGMVITIRSFGNKNMIPLQFLP